ncbi:hypothetical protein Pelo_17999 [Pelomyxa schiedti]|nr:hypothetical protein Pelo_17999 [Pelomyxa schiedti]
MMSLSNNGAKGTNQVYPIIAVQFEPCLQGRIGSFGFERKVKRPSVPCHSTQHTSYSVSATQQLLPATTPTLPSFDSCLPSLPLASYSQMG